MITEGIELFEDPSFVGCRTFLDTAPAVEKMFFYTDFWSEGLAIILTEVAVRSLPKLGICLAGWAKKMDKVCGRRRSIDPWVRRNF